jgi:hypothetical protein
MAQVPEANRIQVMPLDGTAPAPVPAAAGGGVAASFAGDYVSTYLRSTFSSLQASSTRELRPMSEFLAKDRFNLPAGPRDVVPRVKANLGYYSANYAAIFILLAVYCVFVIFTVFFSSFFSFCFSFCSFSSCFSLFHSSAADNIGFNNITIHP